MGAAVLVTVLWSSSWVLIRIGLDDEELTPITFAGLRYGLAAVVLGAVILVRPPRRRELRSLDGASIRLLAGLGVVFYAVTQGAQFVAIDEQPAATTSLVLSFTPVLVGIAAHRSLGERPTAGQMLGGGLIAAGALVYFGGALGASAAGMAAAVVALGANVGGALLGRSANRTERHSPLVVTTVSMAVGAALLVASGVAIDGTPSVSPRAALIVLWLAVVNTAIAFTLWNFALRRLSALETAGINNTMLVQIAVLAWVFLDEAPGLTGGAGIVIVTAGVYLTQLARRV